MRDDSGKIQELKDLGYEIVAGAVPKNEAERLKRKLLKMDFYAEITAHGDELKDVWKKAPGDGAKWMKSGR